MGTAEAFDPLAEPVAEVVEPTVPENGEGTEPELELPGVAPLSNESAQAPATAPVTPPPPTSATAPVAPPTPPASATATAVPGPPAPPVGVAPGAAPISEISLGTPEMPAFGAVTEPEPLDISSDPVDVGSNEPDTIAGPNPLLQSEAKVATDKDAGPGDVSEVTQVNSPPDPGALDLEVSESDFELPPDLVQTPAPGAAPDQTSAEAAELSTASQIRRMRDSTDDDPAPEVAPAANPVKSAPAAAAPAPEAAVAAKPLKPPATPRKTLATGEVDVRVLKKLKLLESVAELLLEKGIITQDELREHLRKKARDD